MTHKQYLRFNYQGKLYQFNCLPFGLLSAPWVVIKTLKRALASLQKMGVRLIAYIDDILIAETREMAKNYVWGLKYMYLLQCLSFKINLQKSVLKPAQNIEFEISNITRKKRRACSIDSSNYEL